MAEHATTGEIKTEQELQPGKGAILRDGLAKVAVYRDDQGVLHRGSASCTHLGCIVHWNSLEKCWDCPCHGSHFSPHGDVLNGPVVAPLAAAK